MSILSSIFSVETDGSANTWLMDWEIGRMTEAGARVNPETAVTLSAYFACLRAISEDIAKLPFIVYRRLHPRGKERAHDHPVYPLLHDAPSDDMSAMAFRETLTAHAMGWGGGFAEIARTPRGVPTGMYPIHPSRVSIGRDDAGRLNYTIRTEDIAGKDVVLRSDQVFHIHGLGIDGISGYSLSVVGKEAIGLGLAAEGFGARFFRNDARPGGVLQHPGQLGDEAVKHLRDSWAAMHSGVEQSHTPAILEEGMEWATTGIPPEEAQFLETRQFQVEEIARWFRMPPHKIQHLLRATFSNIEAQNIEYVGDTLQPWAVRWEQEAKRKLFLPGETDYFAEHLFKGLLRGDQNQRVAFYNGMFNIGAMSQNDIREAENENPVDEGDVYYIRREMQPAEFAAKGDPEPPAEPAQVGPDEEPDKAEADERIQASYLPLFKEAAERLVTKETKAALRAAKKYAGDAKGFAEWAESFFQEHEGYVVQALVPPVVSCALLLGHMGVGMDMRVGGFAQTYINESLMGLRIAFGAGTVLDWASARTNEVPARVADELMRMVMGSKEETDAAAET